MPELGPGVTPGARLTRVVSCVYVGHNFMNCQEFSMTGPTPDSVTSVNQVNTDNGSLIQPIRLSFNDEDEGDKGKGVDKGSGDKGEEDLRKPYKEVLKLPFTRRIIEFSALSHRMPTNLKIYDGSTALNDHITRFVGATNQRQWLGRPPGKIVKRFALRRKCCKDPTEFSRIIQKANETLHDFKERWTEEMSYIPDVPEVMHISAIMSNSKCPELAKRFFGQVPKTVTKMIGRVDDFVKSEEAYKSTELPKGEHPEKGQWTAYRGGRLPRMAYGVGHSRLDNYNNHNRTDHYQPYVSPQPHNRRYNNQRQEVNHLSLDSLVKKPNEILAIELQLQLRLCPSMTETLKKENLDRYYDYHGEKGHYTNDSYQLKRQLEVLESRKLSHLVKDVKHMGNNKGRQLGNNNGKWKVNNMVWERIDGRKRKSRRYVEENWMNTPITFSPVLVDDVTDDPLIIKAEVEGYLTELVGFSREQVVPIGKVKLEVMFGGKGHCQRMMMKIIVVRASSPYNIILGCSRMRELRAVSSTIHAMMKFPTTRGIATLVTRTSPVYECHWSEKKKAVQEEKVKETELGEQTKSEEEKMQLGRNLEAYVDDMVIKCKTEMIMDIAETFDNLRKINMKLNPKKCLFGVEEGKFLGYIVMSERIRENPKKTKAMAYVQSSKTLKEITQDEGLSAEGKGSLEGGNMPVEQQKEDVLSKMASVAFNHLTKEVLVEVLNAKSVGAQEVNMIVKEEKEYWMTPIIKCLYEGVWPTDENESRTLWIKIGHYANYIMREVHEGACKMHAEARFVVAKIMGKPFYQWGLDILGPLPEIPDKLKFIIVAIDYFTKWFGLSKVIVTNYGTQLVNDPFKSWCEKWKIRQMNTAVAYPQANGLVERANKPLMHGLKARLGRKRVGWVDELPNILWPRHTMLKTRNGETPFSLTYESEAVIPAEIGMSTYRTLLFNEAQNKEEIRLNVDLIQENEGDNIKYRHFYSIIDPM
uniref:Integrase catalytic domain-containing protein n=1 Tax=Tanacetum cinerariifolium TaxID=118510 RepID=A0A6L2LMP6_TANCI|nr:hypothetical protein [Tanacetum cinerariifolium]